MRDCVVLVHASLEVDIRHLARARAVATWLVLSGFSACAPALRPAIPAAPRASDQAPLAAVASNGGLTSDSATIATTTSLPDSVDASLEKAIASVSALFDVPDSVLHGYAARRLSDVDPPSNVGGDTEPSWDIDVDSYVTHEKVSRYVKLFLGTSKAGFAERLQRGKQYEPMIREKLRAAGIPEDMYFLALVESGYDPHAYSRAAAVGMWQFMSSTARGVGLRVDWWIDERRDPAKSTDAAARFIRDLRGQFGSLYLAAAAYNGGPGRVSRGLKKFDGALEEVSGEDCFFALAEQDYLRAETKNYVPQLIAAALIGKAPDRYGIVLDSVAPYAYDSVQVPASTPLAAVAKAAGLSVRDVQLLNGHVLRGVTPPEAPFTIHLPVGKGASFGSLFNALNESDRQAFSRVTVKKGGESLAAIAKRHGVQSRHVQVFNRKMTVRKGRVSAGQKLLIPSAAVVQGAFDFPDPAIERYGTSAGGSTAGATRHVVRRGESLGLIANRYRTSVSALMRLNGLKRSVIYAGQTIIVRGPTRSTSATTTKAPATRTTTKRPVAKSSSGKSSVAKSTSIKPAASKARTTSSSKPKATTSSKK